MGNSHPPDGPTRDKTIINAMTAELQTIISRQQLVMKRSEELAAQIVVYEKRQEYVRAALEESRRIAADISSDALQRVDKVMSNTQKVIDPQQAEIARLEAEIAGLQQELEGRPSEEATHLTPPSAQWSESEPGAPEVPDPDLTGPYRSRDEQRHSAPRPLGRISVLEMHPDKNQPAAFEPSSEIQGADTRSEAGPKAPAGIPKVASPVMDTYIKPLSIDEEHRVVPAVEMIGKREFSLREPQDAERTVPVEPSDSSRESADIQAQTVTEGDPSRPGSIETKPVQSLPPEQPRSEMNLPPMSVITSERTELSRIGGTGSLRELVEERENSSIMHLDVFLDTRHFHFVDPWNKQEHQHRWHVKVQVEVPRDQEVAYSQLLSAVTSALSRYDDVLLNEVFPFDHVDPSHENVAGYFFNSLEDMVAAKGLRVIEVGLWEKQNLVLQVHTRNVDVDAVLRGENDLNQIRESLYHESSADAETSFRRMLGMMFKNRN